MSSKKHSWNANHLLSFTVAPVASASTPPSRPRASGGPAVDVQTIKKAVFLQNFQFILRADCDEVLVSHVGGRAPALLRDFDSLVPWDAIAFVVTRASIESFTCPICLEAPVAPRITTCSHIYCYSCILRYMMRQKALGAPRTCPMCSAFVSPSGLRPAICLPVEPPVAGATASFELLCREKHSSCVALAEAVGDVVAAHGAKAAFVPLWGAPSSPFSRYSMETPQLRQQQQDQDVHDLQAKLSMIDTLTCPMTEDDAAEAEAISTAMSFTSADLRSTFGIGGGGGGGKAHNTPARDPHQHHQHHQHRRHAGRGGAVVVPGGHLAQSLSAAEVCGRGAGAEACIVRQTRSPSGSGVLIGCSPPGAAIGIPSEPLALVFFYRSADGQQLYLQPLNMRMLSGDVAATEGERGGGGGRSIGAGGDGCDGGGGGGSGAHDTDLPRSVTARIVDIETITQSPHTRARSHRALAHLPEHSSFDLAFTDLTEIVREETMRAYKATVAHRTRRLREVREAEEAFLAESGDADAKWTQYKSESLSRSGGGGSSPPPPGGVSPDIPPNLAELPELPPAMALPQSATDRQGKSDKKKNKNKRGNAGLTSLSSSSSRGTAHCDPQGKLSLADVEAALGVRTVAATTAPSSPPPAAASDVVDESNSDAEDAAAAGTLPAAGGPGRSSWGGSVSARVAAAGGRGRTALVPPKPSWGAREWAGGSINARPVPPAAATTPAAGRGRGGRVVVAASASADTTQDAHGGARDQVAQQQQQQQQREGSGADDGSESAVVTEEQRRAPLLSDFIRSGGGGASAGAQKGKRTHRK